MCPLASQPLHTVLIDPGLKRAALHPPYQKALRRREAAWCFQIAVKLLGKRGYKKLFSRKTNPRPGRTPGAPEGSQTPQERGSWGAGLGCGERFLAAPFLLHREPRTAGTGTAEEGKGHRVGRGVRRAKGRRETERRKEGRLKWRREDLFPSLCARHCLSHYRAV